MATNEMAKGGGIKQTKPQETDSTYSKAIDKQVAGKPVGYRFTDKLAKKLGKKPGTKPTAAEIEKYKNRGVYFETRKNKSDLNPKAKLEMGGDVEYAKGGQTSPQRESYSKRGDKEVKAKPVGYRFTEKLANRLGKNVFTKPTQEQIEKYRGKGVYFENRKDKSDINPRAMFELGGENPDEKLKVKVFVEVHEDDYKEGEGQYVNSYRVDWLKEDIVKAKDLVKYLADNLYLSENPNDYVVFQDGRIDTDQLQDEDGSEASKRQIEMWKDGKIKLYNAHFTIKVEAVSNSRTPSVEELTSITNIGAYAKGGQTSPQRESYSKRGDQEVKAKPVGYRFTEKLANRLGKNVYTKPTQEQVEKYRGRGVYFENRKDKSDINPRAMFEEGGDMEYAKGGFFEHGLRKGDKIVEGKSGNFLVVVNDGKEYMIDISKGERYPMKENTVYPAVKNPKKEDGGDVEYAKGGKIDGMRERVIDYYYENDVFDDYETYGLEEEDLNDLKKVEKAIIDYHDLKDPKNVKERYKVLGFDSDEYAKGGQTAPQRESYSKRGDQEVKAKPVGYRFTKSLAKRLGKNPFTKPTAEQVRKYLGKGVYFENRKDKSDINPRAMFEQGGDMEYAKGGQTAPQETDSTYSKSIDKRVSGKPVGYRFTNKLAKKLGKNPQTAPKSSEIEKYSGKGVYFETRKNKSDLNPKAKLEGGGESEYARGGGVPRTSNSDSKAYTENHLPFMANNLEGKTLENGDYVVLSYGYYPIWFWHKRTNKWYGNKDKFSVTTAKQISQSRPTYEAEMLSRGEMDNLMSKSIEGKDFKEMGGTLDSFVVAQQ